MAIKCERPDAGGGFRPWPSFSVTAIRRRVLAAMACGGSGASASTPSASSSCRLPGRKGAALRHRPPERKPGESDRLGELMRAEKPESAVSEVVAEAVRRRKLVALEALQRAVGGLRMGEGVGCAEKTAAASEVRSLAKDDAEAREKLAMLGAIPPLVGMLDSKVPDLHIEALYALLNLGIGNDQNKAAIVEAGAVHKMLQLMDFGSSPAVSEAIIANFLSLSALDSNKPIIGASGVIPFLLATFEDRIQSSTTAREDALRALFNLSISPSNASRLVDAGLVPTLLAAIGDMAASERALSVLCNLVSAGEGRRALSRSADAFPILVDVLSWCDAAGCQEKAAYVLMVMAHKGYNDRAAMLEAGIVSALLELTLLGSPLAQKRASRLLEMLTTNKGKGVPEAGGSSGMSAVSAPLCSATAGAAEGEVAEEGMSAERRAVRELVQQSLQNNMRRIARRANLPPDFAPSERLQTLTATSTSKSLPF